MLSNGEAPESYSLCIRFPIRRLRMLFCSFFLVELFVLLALRFFFLVFVIDVVVVVENPPDANKWFDLIYCNDEFHNNTTEQWWRQSTCMYKATNTLSHLRLAITLEHKFLNFLHTSPQLATHNLCNYSDC